MGVREMFSLSKQSKLLYLQNTAILILNFHFLQTNKKKYRGGYYEKVISNHYPGFLFYSTLCPKCGLALGKASRGNRL